MPATRRAPSKQAKPSNPKKQLGGVRSPAEASTSNGGSPRRRGAPATASAPRRGVEYEGVSHVQRSRMLDAIAEVCAENGAPNVTVAHIVARAGVSRRTFYEQFDDREDCFLAAFDEAFGRVAERARAAYEDAPAGWRQRVRAALWELLGFLEEDPASGRLLVVESLAAGRLALARRDRMLAALGGVVDRGRGAARGGLPAGPLAAEGVVGAVLTVVHRRLLEDELCGFSELLNPLMSMIVLPYLGPAAARRELAQPAPQARHGASKRPASANPLERLGMRLTYRTIRVLAAVAEHPGASNRTIGKSAGVADQGQISKLLARLGGLGLIDNGGQEPGRGAPNAWTLTMLGEEVHGALTARV